MLSSPALDELVGGRMLLKAEILQRTGTFKFRGACNFVQQIPAEDRPRGVVAHSSGNHAQGVAAAAALHGIPATIVMPSDAPAVKRERTESYGARVVAYDRLHESREGISRSIAAETGATLVPPYDHPWTIAGQGTAGLEMAHQARAAGATLDAVLVPCSGGGLTAGIALALHGETPGTAVVTVEPEAFDDTARSLAAGERLSADPAGASICDALLVPTPGELTFAINRRLVAGGVSVTDDDVRRAMRYAFHELKVVVEPGGAAALAAVLSGTVDVSGRTVGIVLSGGNVDPGLISSVVA
jgi:threonine dehydratase